MNTSNMFRLNLADLEKGVLIAVLTPIVTALGAAMNLPGFDFMSFDWKHLIGLGIAAGITYLFKNFMSDTKGSFAGVVG